MSIAGGKSQRSGAPAVACMEGGVIVEEEGDHGVVPAELRVGRKGGKKEEKGGFCELTSLR